MENLQDEVTEIIADSTFAMKVYKGIGFVDTNDMAQYFVSLDPDPGNYVFNIFKIRNEGFFIHLNNGIDDVLRNPTNNIYKIVFNTKKKTPIPKIYKVVLYHENSKISKEKAVKLFDELKDEKPFDHTIFQTNRYGTGTIRN